MNSIRNIGIVAHVDAGKTTLTEQMLYLSGKVRVLGKVDQGSSNMDWWTIEKERGITVFSEQAEILWKNHQINLIDTPGHADFAAELDRALMALDGVILVISAVEGVQSHTEVIWDQLRKRQIPTLIFVNKLDRVGANLTGVYEEVKSRLSEAVIPIQTTALCERDFKEITDILREKRYVWGEGFSGFLTDDYSEDILRQGLVEQIAELDEEILGLYLNGSSPSSDQLLRTLSRLTRNNQAFPLLIGSGLRSIGVLTLLDYIIDLLPPPRGKIEDPLAALIYKVRFDESVGKLCYVRVFNGKIRVRDSITLPQGDLNCEEKITQIRKYDGGKFRTVDSLVTGEIGVLCGLSQGVAGLFLGKNKLSWEASFRPVLTTKVIPEDEGNLFELIKDLEKLNQEEPTIDLEWDTESRQIKIKIMGLIQMEIIENIVFERFGKRVKLGVPQVNYLETITEVTQGFCHFEPKKHYAEVEIELIPGKIGQGIKFNSALSTDDLPLQYQHAIEKSVPEALLKGPLTGRPVTDLTIKLTAAKHHLEHTHGGDFRIATIRAIQQALQRNEILLLEPLYQFRISTSKEYLGRIMSDVLSFNGRLMEPEIKGERVNIQGEVPVANFMNYTTELNALTSGQGLISLQFSRYGQCSNQSGVVKQLQSLEPVLKKEKEILYNSVSLFREKRKMKKVQEGEIK